MDTIEEAVRKSAANGGKITKIEMPLNDVMDALEFIPLIAEFEDKKTHIEGLTNYNDIFSIVAQ